MSTYDRLRDLPLVVEEYALEGLKTRLSGGLERLTTVIELRGAGDIGLGEDVTYEAELQRAFASGGARLPLAGRHTLDSFSRLVGSADTFGHPPEREEYRSYRRWGFESAALDLGLRQAGMSLADALGREPRPTMFVVSMRLGDPPSIEPLEALVRRFPWMRFKLDATSDWTDELASALATTGRVETIDFKGAYSGTPVDQPPDRLLYRRIVETFPHAWLEDPGQSSETDEIIAPFMDRVTWDAPLHSVDDIRNLRHKPRIINVKPSRFGSVRMLCDVYDHCAHEGIRAYGGGQFELGPGRGQIQYLAALFHPDGPNDVAPAGFNKPEPPAGLPKSPLPPPNASHGFRREERMR